MVVAPHLLHPVTSSPPAADLRKRGDQAQLAGAPPLEKIRDTLYREDDSTVRTRSGPRTMATLRNLAVGALHQAGRHDTTEATRWAGRYIDRPFTILGLMS